MKWLKKVDNTMKNIDSKKSYWKMKREVFFKYFPISVLIVTVVLAIAWFICDYIDNKVVNNINYPAGLEMESYDTYMDSQKDVASDIEGMSIYDKYAMGLETKEGSDSDYDGLTDKEEIEVYGTDPLKSSTAGDLYSDSYKVQNEMDLFTYYEYEGEQIFEFVECPEVRITASVPTDFYTVVQDYTDKYSLEEYNIKKTYKSYCLYNYGGEVSIDLSSVLAENNITMKEVKVYISDSMFLVEEPVECRYDTDDEVITLNYEFDDDIQYIIFIAGEKQLKINSMLEDLFGDFSSNEKEVEDEFTGEAIMYGFPLFEIFFKKGYTVEYTTSSDDNETELFKNDLVTYCQKIIKADYTPSPSTMKESDRTQIIAKQKLFDSLLNVFELKLDEKVHNPICIFFSYTKVNIDYTNSNIVEDELVTVEDTEINTSFDKYIDELPFQNFESYISPSGNCAGISHLTSYLFNKGFLPERGSYNCKIDGQYENIEWDISNDSQNNTLINPGLIDYKSEQFVDLNSDEDNNYLDTLYLSEGEKEFVDMIGCFWAEGNSHIDYSNLYPAGTLEDYSVIENMMDYLDQGKIVDVYLYMRYGGGHAVNVYGYREIEGEIAFYVYDSNIPQDNREGCVLDNTLNMCMLQTVKLICKDGSEKVIYLYYPMSDNPSYMALNAGGKQEYHMLQVMDENWNILN